jgi:hypothetical protein
MNSTAKFMELIVCLIRSIYAALLALVLFSSNGASAGDFSLIYAIDANGKTDAGKIKTCEYFKTCEIESADLRLSISLWIIRPDHSSAELHVNGPPGCCYSIDAAETIYLSTEPGLRRVPLYQGRARRGNEFVRNKRFGMLYLEFSDMR